jgi:hypothetical protein
MRLPSAIIFVNNDMNQTLQDTLVSQLFIHEAITGTEFDLRVELTPTYPDMIHLQGMRILVIRDDFMDLTNREYADVAIFVKSGLASIELNKIGPPNKAYRISELSIYKLLC